MGDYFPGRIHIGGSIDLKKVDMDDLGRLAWLLSEQHPDYAGNEPKHSINASKPETFMAAVDKNAKVIICEDAEASGGMFEDIEEVCQHLGLSYDRWSDAKYECEGEYVRYRPGMKEPFTVEANNDGTQVCDRAPVLEAYDLLNQDRVKEARKLLMRTLYTGGETPVEPEQLPPFRIA